MGASNDVNNGRVTTREFYEALMETTRTMEDMERRIMSKLENLPSVCNQVDTNTKEIEKLRTKSNALDIFNGVLAAVFAALAAILGN